MADESSNVRNDEQDDEGEGQVDPVGTPGLDKRFQHGEQSTWLVN